ncbi:GDAP2 [Cordylochernes scorpioides]|uniref:GDAP2 n=1 Tax=Cordylochernes scorpioides TaxID=51811 RepID=A0ABY6LBH7_9ARAC|nr:GDAP2 [Cordylochernes scorpioides]
MWLGADDNDDESLLKLDGSVAVGHTDFAVMKGDQDRMYSNRHKDALTTELQRQTRVAGCRYQRLLRKARAENFGNLANLKFIYHSGEDKVGRPVVVIVGQRLNSDILNFDQVLETTGSDDVQALLYTIQLLDPLVYRDYVVVYFHTQCGGQQGQPTLTYLREAYNLLDYKYKKNLKAFYIVHPTFWSRVLTWWFTTFTAATVKNKIQSLGGVEYLYFSISPSQLEVPSFILEHDIKVGPSLHMMETNHLH